MGFAMVKAYDAVGHQWAFTSMTCNVQAAGQMQLPTDWAVAIWEVTKDLAGNIRFNPGGTDKPWFEVTKPPAGPPPAPGPGLQKGPAAKGGYVKQGGKWVVPTP